MESQTDPSSWPGCSSSALGVVCQTSTELDGGGRLQRHVGALWSLVGECHLAKSRHLHGLGRFTCSWGWARIPCRVAQVDKGFPALRQCVVPAALTLLFPASLSTPPSPRVLLSGGSDFGGRVGHVQGTWPLPPASAGEVPVAGSACC